MNDFGRKIRALRIQQGLSLQNVSNRLNISKPYLSLIETGARIPSEAVIRRLARFFGEDEDTWAFWVKEAPLIERINKKYPDQAFALMRRAEGIQSRGG